MEFDAPLRPAHVGTNCGSGSRAAPSPASGRYRVRVAPDDNSTGAYEVAVGSTALTPKPLALNAPAAGAYKAVSTSGASTVRRARPFGWR